MPSTDQTLIAALRILARDIISSDGVANATIAEAADRLEELSQPRPQWRQPTERLSEAQKARLLKQIDIGPWKTSWHLPRTYNRINWDDMQTLTQIRDVLMDQITDASQMRNNAEACIDICVGDMVLLDELQKEQENENGN